MFFNVRKLPILPALLREFAYLFRIINSIGEPISEALNAGHMKFSYVEVRKMYVHHEHYRKFFIKTQKNN